MLRRTIVTLLLLAPSVFAAEMKGCPIDGDKVDWIADYCMATLETDDLVPAAACIGREIRRVFPDDCVAKTFYKSEMCGMALSRRTITGTVRSCTADGDFKGLSVRGRGTELK